MPLMTARPLWCSTPFIDGLRAVPGFKGASNISPLTVHYARGKSRGVPVAIDSQQEFVLRERQQKSTHQLPSSPCGLIETTGPASGEPRRHLAQSLYKPGCGGKNQPPWRGELSFGNRVSPKIVEGAWNARAMRSENRVQCLYRSGHATENNSCRPCCFRDSRARDGRDGRNRIHMGKRRRHLV
jgi:hypothetical protein